jgi:hypothetical protein
MALLVSCKSSSTNPDRKPNSPNRLKDISIGDLKKSVLEKMGQPNSKNIEKYQTTEYEIFEYTAVNGIPLGYISLDSKLGTVAGRAIWISKSQPESDFSILQKRLAPEGRFTKTFVSCDKHHWAEFKVDPEKGIFVGVDRNGVFLISWSNPQLTKLRIEQFAVKCPERQNH